jgi:hypothetical protein
MIPLRLTDWSKRGKIAITCKDGESGKPQIDLLCYRSSLVSEKIRDNPKADMLDFPDLFIEDFENLRQRIYRSPTTKLNLPHKISCYLAAEHLGMVSILEEDLIMIRDDPNSHQLDSGLVDLVKSRATADSRFRVMLGDKGNAC